MGKHPIKISQGSANVSMSKSIINLLQQNRANKVGGEEEKLIHHQVQMLIRKFFRNRSSQVNLGNETVWAYH